MEIKNYVREEDMGSISDKVLRYPAWIAVIFTVITTLTIYYFLPYEQYQVHIWIFALVAYVIGDSITTGLLGKHNLPEGQRLTHWLCGIHPTFQCAFASRVGIFIIIFGIYLFLNHLIPLMPLIKRTVYLIPVAISTMGVIAAFLNTHAVLLVRRGSLRTPESEETE